MQPKNIDISLSARWPASPAAVEAAEFVAEEDTALFWRFAEGLAKEDSATAQVRRGEGTDREQFDHVIGVASGLLSPLGLRMLKAFFAAHVLSPRAEMWRQLAEDEAQQFEVPTSATAWLRSCGRALPIDAQPAAAIASLIEAVTGSADCAVPVALAACPYCHRYYCHRRSRRHCCRRRCRRRRCRHRRRAPPHTLLTHLPCPRLGRLRRRIAP